MMMTRGVANSNYHSHASTRIPGGGESGSSVVREYQVLYTFCRGLVVLPSLVLQLSLFRQTRRYLFFHSQNILTRHLTSFLLSLILGIYSYSHTTAVSIHHLSLHYCLRPLLHVVLSQISHSSSSSSLPVRDGVPERAVHALLIS